MGKRAVWGRTVWAERATRKGRKGKGKRELWRRRLRVRNLLATCGEVERTQEEHELSMVSPELPRIAPRIAPASAARARPSCPAALSSICSFVTAIAR